MGLAPLGPFDHTLESAFFSSRKRRLREGGLWVLGSTGSIGRQTLDVAQQQGLKIRGLACARQIDLLAEQIEIWRPAYAAVADPVQAQSLREKLAHTPLAACKILAGEAELCAVLRQEKPCTVVQAMVGMAGIAPAIAAIEGKHDLAIANKEVLVAAGDLIGQYLKRQQTFLLPIDSEHSAIWQALMAGRREDLSHIYLTASGGPFRGLSREQLLKVSRAEALRHPTWSMGGKISIDSATLMNKGLELIEAARLFALEEQAIEVVIHPQSVIHSMLSFHDGSVLAQMGEADMRLPIQYALSWPQRWPVPERHYDPLRCAQGHLTFEPVDPKTFPAINLARLCLKRGGAWPLFLNAANEVFVEAFLSERLSFLGIVDQLTKLLEQGDATWDQLPESLEMVQQLDLLARELARAQL